MIRQNIKAIFISILIVFLFFYPILNMQIPFPGDLLMNINPYDTLEINGYLPGGVSNKAQGIDVIREMYPWKFFAVKMLSQGQIPFWNPYNFSGNPQMANFQTGTFYPLNLLFVLFSFNIAWTIYIMLIPFLSSVFLFFFLRELKLSKASSLFGGIIFAFSSYMVVWIEYGNIGHTLLWLPFVLLITEKYIKSRQAKYLLLIALSLWTSFSAGYIQGYFYLFSIVIFYFSVKSLKNNMIDKKRKTVFYIATLLPLLLAAYQFLPTLELFGNSSRNNYSLNDIQNLLNPWWYAITVIVPDFFGNPATRNHFFNGTYIERVSYFGIAPLIFAIFAFSCFRRRIDVKIFGILFIISFVLAIDLIFVKYIYVIPIPIISTTVPTRILSIFVFSGAVLSAFGLEEFFAKKKFKIIIILILIILALLLLIMLFTVLSGSSVTQKSLYQPLIIVFCILIGILVLARFIKFKKLFILFIYMLTFFELFKFFHKITPFTPSEFIYPETEVVKYIQEKAGLYRYWGYNRAQFISNVQLVDNTYLPDGHDALHLKSYGEFLSGIKKGKLGDNLSRSDSEVLNGNDTMQLKFNKYRQKVFNILAIKYVVLRDEFIEQDNVFRESFRNEKWSIYENKTVMPRAFITDKYLVIPDKKRVLENFFDLNFNEREYVILEKDPGLIGRNLKLKSAELIKYEPNRVIIKTKSDGNAILFLSDNNYPGWKAKVDGREENIYTANYTFRAVKVPKGEHFVEFYYFPESFRNGLLVSGFTTLFLIIIALYVFIKKKRTVK